MHTFDGSLSIVPCQAKPWGIFSVNRLLKCLAWRLGCDWKNLSSVPWAAHPSNAGYCRTREPAWADENQGWNQQDMKATGATDWLVAWYHSLPKNCLPVVATSSHIRSNNLQSNTRISGLVWLGRWGRLATIIGINRKVPSSPTEFPPNCWLYSATVPPHTTELFIYC